MQACRYLTVIIQFLIVLFCFWPEFLEPTQQRKVFKARTCYFIKKTPALKVARIEVFALLDNTPGSIGVNCAD